MKNVFRISLLISITLLTGCEKTDQIEEHIVPPMAPALTQKEKEATEGKESRMLAAIFPLDGQGYFFKMQGAPEAVQIQFPNFSNLVKSLKFEQGELVWKLPKGWKNLPSKGMRLATIQLPKEEKTDSQLEISVFKLPMNGGKELATLDNINRWRGQLGLESVTKNDLLSDDTEKGGVIRMKCEEGEVVVVNLLGKKSASRGMRPPFAR